MSVIFESCHMTHTVKSIVGMKGSSCLQYLTASSHLQLRCSLQQRLAGKQKSILGEFGEAMMGNNHFWCNEMNLSINYIKWLNNYEQWFIKFHHDEDVSNQFQQKPTKLAPNVWASPFAKVSTSSRSAPWCPFESSLLSANQEALRTAADVSPSPWLKISKDLHVLEVGNTWLVKNSAINLKKYLLTWSIFSQNLWSRKYRTEKPEKHHSSSLTILDGFV